METRGVNLLTGLQRTTQSGVYGTPPAATAGIITSRAAAAGVLHRRHQPRDVPLHAAEPHVQRHGEVHDTSRPPDRIRQDVSAQPGRRQPAVPEQLRRLPLAAWIRWRRPSRTTTSTTPQGRLVYTPGAGAGEVLPSTTDNFKYGFRTPDDDWENYWRQGQNALLGWDSALPGSGNGAKSLGQEFAS